MVSSDIRPWLLTLCGTRLQTGHTPITIQQPQTSQLAPTAHHQFVSTIPDQCTDDHCNFALHCTDTDTDTDTDMEGIKDLHFISTLMRFEWEQSNYTTLSWTTTEHHLLFAWGGMAKQRNWCDPPHTYSVVSTMNYLLFWCFSFVEDASLIITWLHDVLSFVDYILNGGKWLM